MAIIDFRLKNLKPNKTIITEAIITGIVASIVVFILSFFGLMAFFNWIPKGFEVFALVFIAVYLKHLIEVKI